MMIRTRTTIMTVTMKEEMMRIVRRREAVRIRKREEEMTSICFLILRMVKTEGGRRKEGCNNKHNSSTRDNVNATTTTTFVDS